MWPAAAIGVRRQSRRVTGQRGGTDSEMISQSRALPASTEEKNCWLRGKEDARENIKRRVAKEQHARG